MGTLSPACAHSPHVLIEFQIRHIEVEINHQWIGFKAGETLLSCATRCLLEASSTRDQERKRSGPPVGCLACSVASASLLPPYDKLISPEVIIQNFKCTAVVSGMEHGTLLRGCMRACGTAAGGGVEELRCRLCPRICE